MFLEVKLNYWEKIEDEINFLERKKFIKWLKLDIKVNILLNKVGMFS